MGAPGDFERSEQKTKPYTPALRRALRRLDTLVDWERRRRSGPPGASRAMRVNAQPARELLQRLGQPQNTLRCVHITGSKGKGSVATMIAYGLRSGLFRDTTASHSGGVATYGSPHVERITERMRFNGQPIDDDSLAQALEEALAVRMREPAIMEATWFDVLTASALLAFRQAGAGRAVVEVGMGGRNDSTNVLHHHAPVAVITNVHLEHASIIGPTHRDIAYEKAGIITAGTKTAIVGMHEDDELAPIFRAEAARHQKRASVCFLPPQPNETLLGTNLRLARAALRAVAQHERLTIDDESLLLSESDAHNALASLPARQELFVVRDLASDTSVAVLLDGAHIPSSVAQVLVEVPWPRHAAVIIVAVGHDKDIDGIARAVIPHASVVFATAAGTTSPYLPAEDTAEAMKRAGCSDCRVEPDPEEATRLAIAAAAQLDTGVIVIGSLHLAGKVRPLLHSLQMQQPSIMDNAT